jgi:hypothetical protein
MRDMFHERRSLLRRSFMPRVSELLEIEIVAGDAEVFNDVGNDSARNISGVPCESNQAIWPEGIGKVAVTSRRPKVFATDFLEPAFQLPAIP